MRCLIIVAALIAAAQAHPVLFYSGALHQPIGVEYASDPNPGVHTHPAVELNAASEALLPRELLKSKDFYDNPVIANKLAEQSWFFNKEMLVLNRESEHIPRQKIYEIIKHAGFLDHH